MKYIIYCRKSTESEDRQVLSIDSQERELLDLANSNNYYISKSYKESKTAKEPGRKIFEEMLNFIEKNREEYCILVWNLDRLARNSIDGGRIIYLLDKGSISEIRTPSKVFKNTSDDKFMMSLLFGFAKKYVDDLSVNVKRGNRAKLEKGGWPGSAPLGYINDKENKTLIIDPEKAYFVKRCFELFSTSRYTISKISNLVKEEGMRSRNGNVISRSNIYKLLKNPFYYGLMVKGESVYQGNHSPIISKDLFDLVQKVFSKKVHFKEEKHFFHLRGLFVCANCGCALTASRKKGHDYYYCTNGRKLCSQHKHYLRSEFLDGFLLAIFEKLEIDEELINIVYEASRQKMKINKTNTHKNELSLLKQLKAVENKQSLLLDSFISMTTPKDVYASKMKELTNEQITIKEQLSKQETEKLQEEVLLKRIKDFFLDASKMKKEYIMASPERKNIIANKLLWNLNIKNQEVLSFKAKEPFNILLKGSKIQSLFSLQGRKDSNPQDFFWREAVYR